MKIIALDQATNTGYAVLDMAGNLLESGVWKLADPKRTGESRGMRYIRFRKNLEELISKHYETCMIVHEQTLLRGGAATEIANSLKGLILMIAAERHLEVSCVHTSELKKWATADGKATKDEMIYAVYLHGLPAVRDDNEADAILIGLWAAAKYGLYKRKYDPFKDIDPSKTKSKRRK